VKGLTATERIEASLPQSTFDTINLSQVARHNAIIHTMSIGGSTAADLPATCKEQKT